MTNTLGRLAEAYTAPTASGTKATDEGFSYTGRGEVSDVYESTPKSGEYYHTNATYFANGALSTLSDVIAGVTWAYTIDGKGRPYSAVQNPSTNLVSSTTYNAANEPCVVTLGLGDTDSYSYDGVSCTGSLTTGRITSYTFSVGATPKTDIGSLTWNANGTLRSLSTTDGFNSGGTQTCNYGTSTAAGYDEQGRLVSAICANSGGTNVWGQQFSYDAFQNLTKLVPNGDTGVTWAPGYHPTNNQAIGFNYDSNGNLLSDGTNSYTWNQDNHPVSVNSSPATYDAFGNMVENKTDSSALLEELKSPIGNIGIMKKTTVTEYRIPLPGGDTYSVASSNLIWHRDWLGSVRLTSNLSNRNYVADMSFAPFGEIYLGFGSSANSNFTGDNQDLITGDFDTPNRELLPTEGRWLSPDPARASWNAYSYSTKPLGETDPSGLDDNGVRVPLNLACGIGTCDGGLGGSGPSQSNLAGLLDPGAAFFAGAFQQFYVLTGQNSQIQQGLTAYLNCVDLNFRCDSSGQLSKGDGGTGGIVINVFCGGSLGDVDCVPPAQALSTSVDYKTNLLYPGLAPGDIPVGGDFINCPGGCAQIWSSANQVTDPRNIAAWYALSISAALAGGYYGGLEVFDATLSVTPGTVNAIVDVLNVLGPTPSNASTWFGVAAEGWNTYESYQDQH